MNQEFSYVKAWFRKGRGTRNKIDSEGQWGTVKNWHATVHGVAENRTWLTDWTTTKNVDTFNFLKVQWFLNHHLHKHLERIGFPHGSVGKSSACNAGDLGSIPRSGRSPVEGTGNLLQYSCLENPMDRGAWQATINEITRVRHDLVNKQQPYLTFHMSDHHSKPLK